MDTNSDNLFSRNIIKGKSWFKRSTVSIQKKLIDLQKESGGLVKILIDLPEESEEKTLWKVDDLLIGKKLALVRIIRKSEHTNEDFLSEILIPREGNSPFSYGIILLAKNRIPVYLVLSRRESLVSNLPGWHPIEVYSPNFSHDGLIVLPEKYQKDLIQIAGKNIEITKFLDLGKVYPDIQISPKQVPIFVTVVDTEQELDLKTKTKQLSIIPIDELDKLVKQTKDGVLLAILAKARTFGIL